MGKGPPRTIALFVSFVFLSLTGAFAQGPVSQTDTKALGRSSDKAYLDDEPAFDIEPNSFLVETV
jgi:hypothetical protein